MFKSPTPPPQNCEKMIKLVTKSINQSSNSWVTKTDRGGGRWRDFSFARPLVWRNLGRPWFRKSRKAVQIWTCLQILQSITK